MNGPVHAAASAAVPAAGSKRPLGERLLAAGVISRAQLDLALREGRRQGKMLGESLVALGFVTTESSYDRSWHNAPWRQYVVTLSGTWEIETSDGDIRRFGPGDVLLAEDLTGKGHVNRVDGLVERLMIHAREP